MERGSGTGDRGPDAPGTTRPRSPFAGPVAGLSDIPPDGLLGVTLDDGTPVCLVRHAGAVHALHDRCPHAEFSLSSGELLPDGTVQCLWHGARFDCATGAVRQGPATDDVATYEVQVQGEHVFVGLRVPGPGTPG